MGKEIFERNLLKH